MRAAQKLLSVLAAAAFTAACGAAPVVPPEPADVAIVGAHLIDGSGGAPVADSVILIRGDRIVAVGSRAHTGLPAGAEIYDGTGKTVVPGAVDTHGRFVAAGAAEPGALVAGGVADLVVLDGVLDADPLVDGRDAPRIARVMTAGAWVGGYAPPSGRPTKR